jgi:hypothetical protein
MPWKERQYETHIGIPNGLTLLLLFGMYTLLAGLAFQRS